MALRTGSSLKGKTPTKAGSFVLQRSSDPGVRIRAADSIPHSAPSTPAGHQCWSDVRQFELEGRQRGGARRRRVCLLVCTFFVSFFSLSFSFLYFSLSLFRFFFVLFLSFFSIFRLFFVPTRTCVPLCVYVCVWAETLTRAGESAHGLHERDY